MGAVLVIFSFFQTDNDLVCAPPPPIVVFSHHNYAHTLAHISKTTRTIFLKLWKVVPDNIWVTKVGNPLKGTVLEVIRFSSFLFGLFLKIVMVSGTMSENFRSMLKIVMRHPYNDDSALLSMG